MKKCPYNCYEFRLVGKCYHDKVLGVEIWAGGQLAQYSKDRKTITLYPIVILYPIVTVKGLK